ncbi:hypothetical protein SAMN06295960_4128 [Paenibacillus aquistagni]|uniref:Uncharacterized protein n=2 Tax=Paenibacillus aquistagni TaxID=1852522 RepID=A0A1X7LTI5_9BACL|nr:hypothetical protein SAMN06295960_4128 [Paenibacillus aquistagni]
MPKAPVVDGMSPEAKEKLEWFLAKVYLRLMREQEENNGNLTKKEDVPRSDY